MYIRAVQYCEVEIISGEHAGQTCHGSNYMNSALDKDKLFEVGDEALAMIQGDANTLSATLIDHYRLTSEGWLFGLFALLLMLFGGITGLRRFDIAAGERTRGVEGAGAGAAERHGSNMDVAGGGAGADGYDRPRWLPASRAKRW